MMKRKLYTSVRAYKMGLEYMRYIHFLYLYIFLLQFCDEHQMFKIEMKILIKFNGFIRTFIMNFHFSTRPPLVQLHICVTWSVHDTLHNEIGYHHSLYKVFPFTLALVTPPSQISKTNINEENVLNIPIYIPHTHVYTHFCLVFIGFRLCFCVLQTHKGHFPRRE